MMFLQNCQLLLTENNFVKPGNSDLWRVWINEWMRIRNNFSFVLRNVKRLKWSEAKEA